MAKRAYDEETFVLGDEIIDHVDGFFLQSDSYYDRRIQICIALQALINVIGIMLCEIDSEFTTKAVEGSFVRMLKDIPVIKMEADAAQIEQSI